MHRKSLRRACAILGVCAAAGVHGAALAQSPPAPSGSTSPPVFAPPPQGYPQAPPQPYQMPYPSSPPPQQAPTGAASQQAPPSPPPQGYPPGAAPQQYPPGTPQQYPPGAAPQQYPPQGYPPGAAPQQYPPQGYPPGYYPQQAYPGYPPGYYPQGYPPGYYPQMGNGPPIYNGQPGEGGPPLPIKNRRPDVKAIVTGSVMLGLAWSLSTIAAVVVQGDNNGDWKGSEALFVPVLGPFIALGTMDAFGQQNSTEVGLYLIADGLVQISGLISLSLGSAGVTGGSSSWMRAPQVPTVHVGLGTTKLTWQF